MQERTVVMHVVGRRLVLRWVLFGLLVCGTGFQATLWAGPSPKKQSNVEKTPDLPDFYIVKAGDSCLSILAKYGKKLTLDEFHKLNPQIKHKPPHKLDPGLKVYFRPPPPDIPVPTPVEMPASPEAKLTYVKFEVREKAPTAREWQPAQEGEELFRQHRVETATKATADVTFTDDSRIRLRENTLLIIYGDTAAKAVQRHTGVELVHGSLQGGLASLRGDKPPLAVKTPSADVKVTARNLKLEVDKVRASKVSVFEGSAEVTSAGQKVFVPEGQGSVANFGKPPTPPRPLPLAPRWDMASRFTHLQFEGRNRALDITWRPVPEAISYFIEVAYDPQFTHCLIDGPIQSELPTLTVNAPQPGKYYARVSSIDSIGLQSQASDVLEMAIVLVKSESVYPLRNGILMVPPSASFKVDGGDVEIEASIDGKPVNPQNMELAVSGPHTVAIGPRSGGYKADSFNIDLNDITIDTTVNPASISMKGGRVEIRMRVKDGTGQLVKVRYVKLQVGGDRPVKVQAAPTGEYVYYVKIGKVRRERGIAIRAWIEDEPVPRNLPIISQIRRPEWVEERGKALGLDATD